MEQQLTEKFRLHLMQLGYQKSSVHMLPNCVRDFMQHIGVRDPTKLLETHIKQFYEHLQCRPPKRKRKGSTALSESYIHQHMYALQLFFNWLEQTAIINTNPMSNLQFKQPSKQSRESLTQDEIQQLFNAAMNFKETVLLHLFYSCGLRRSEAEALQIEDISFIESKLYVKEGKGAKRRAVPISINVKVDLAEYVIRVCKSVGKKSLVQNAKGYQMSGDNYNRLLKEIMQRTSIDKEISLHHLRHSIATHLLERGMSLEYVRIFLGHESVETTQQYININSEQLKALNDEDF